MVQYLYNDLETYSETPLSRGTHAYAEKAEVLLWAYALDEGAPKVWDVTSGAPMPPELEASLRDKNCTKVWHNGAMFDMVVLKHAMPHLNLRMEEVEDTMVLAYMHGLPGSLDMLSGIYKLGEDKAKMKDGGRLVNLFCVPRPKNMTLRRATRETHPEEWQKFCRYAELDIEAMRALHKRLPRWNCTPFERELFLLDQRINNRGIRVDVALATAALEAVDRAQDAIRDRTSLLTDNDVSNLNQRDRVLEYILEQYGITLPDLRASTVERQLADPDLPEALRELLMLRVQAGAASTRKYKTLLAAMSADSRIRGLLQYCGAQRTMRWAGRTFQPQNLPSRGILSEKEIPTAVDAILAGAVDLVFDDVVMAASSTVRACLVPSKGKLLHVSDLSNIEGRGVAWTAGEEWKLKAFADFDAGTGHDLYAIAYSKAFGVTPEQVMENKKAGGNWRDIGKVMELALGYQGGVGAFVTFALGYGIDLDAMAAGAVANIPRGVWGDSAKAWARAVKDKRTYGLAEQTWRVCDCFKTLWRAAHPNVERMWGELEDAFRAAIQGEERKLYHVGDHLAVSRQRSWVRIHMPNGTCLSYAACRIEEGKITYFGQTPKNKKWARVGTYGGKLFENVNQKLARDIMAHNMLIAERKGYDILLTVHDELVTESPIPAAKSELGKILATQPVWAKGLPLAAGVKVMQRYGK